MFDNIYTVGTVLKSETKLRIHSFSYGYSFAQTDNFDVGATLGFFIMPLSYSLDIDGASSSPSVSSGSTEFIAPLPVIGFHANFAFTPKLTFNQNVSFFYLRVGDYKGNLASLNVNLDYRAWDHFGFGLGLNSFNMGFEKVDSSTFAEFEGQFSYRLTGIMLYLSFYL